MTKIDLQRVLDLDREANEGPWKLTQETLTHPDGYEIVSEKNGCYVASECCGYAGSIAWKPDAELIAHYRTAAPAMAKALQEVIALHVETGGKECLTCTDERGPKPYPCPTVRAIHHHLGGHP